MMIAVFISNDDKIRLIKEEINKIDPNVVIYEEEKDQRLDEKDCSSLLLS